MLLGIFKTYVAESEALRQKLQTAVLVFLTCGTIPAVRRQQKLQYHLAVVMQPSRVGFYYHFILGERLRCGLLYSNGFNGVSWAISRFTMQQ